MKVWRKSVLFYLGGFAYMTLEFVWRGRSHGSMFLLGGACFLILGALRRIPLALRPVAGAAAITGRELLPGLAVHRSYTVWDYRNMPCQYRGQICLVYSLLWIPVSLLGIGLYAAAEKLLNATHRN